MTKEELLKKAKVIGLGKEEIVPLLQGVFIIQQRRLHDSGYRLMYVIGHTEYDKEINDFHYYLLSQCSDVVDIGDMLEHNCTDIHLDINKNGIIHLWTNRNKKLKIKYTNLSNAWFDVI